MIALRLTPFGGKINSYPLLSTKYHSYPLLSTLFHSYPLLSHSYPLLSTLIQLLSTLIQLLSNSYPTLIHSYSLLILRVMFFTLIHSYPLLSTLIHSYPLLSTLNKMWSSQDQWGLSWFEMVYQWQRLWLKTELSEKDWGARVDFKLTLGAPMFVGSVNMLKN